MHRIYLLVDLIRMAVISFIFIIGTIAIPTTPSYARFAINEMDLYTKLKALRGTTENT